ncbi:MAG: hypothetical protein HYY40_13965 [Bacteroidetes bacterium]|nr:hypothetical protein [Bacteroidota bacterium]
MREEQAIVEVISISQKGEIKNFQVKIPMNAIALIGIETGVRMKRKASGGVILPPVPAIPKGAEIISPAPGPIESKEQQSVIGELKLQSPGKPNLFYGTLVRDPFAGEDFSNPLFTTGFRERDWTHGNKKEMEKINVDAHSTVISGFYKDFLGESLKQDTSYEIILALWFKIATKKK